MATNQQQSPQFSYATFRINSKKRRRSDISSKPAVTRRRKSSGDTLSLTSAQKTSLSQAAAVLQKARPDLSIALGEILSQCSGLPAESSRNPKQSFRSRHSPPATMTEKPPILQTPHSSESDQLEPPLSTDQHSDSSSMSNGHNTTSFGAMLLPEQIADCFASFVPVLCEPSISVVETDQLANTYSNTPPTYSNVVSTMAHQTQNQPSFLGDFQRRSRDSMDLISFDDHNSFQHGYACDELFDEWFQHPVHPQNIQQPAAMQNMIYPGNAITFSGDKVYLDAINPNILDSPGLPVQGDLTFLIDQISDNSERSTVSEPEENCGETKSIPTPRRPFQNHRDRQQTAQTRKLTACIRCRMQRIRCEPDPSDPSGVCLTCKRVLKPKVSKLPCLRYKITDVRLFREGPLATENQYSHRWPNFRMENINAWASPDIKTIRVTQNYGEEAGMLFKVREFIPMQGDSLNRWWTDGNVIKSVDVPHYAIVDMDEAFRTTKEYIVNAGPEFFKGTLKDYDKLIWYTYTEALNFSNIAKTEQETKLLQMILQLWVTVRRCTKSNRICSLETLGMSPDILDESSPIHGKIPTPPVFDVQAHILAQKIQLPLRAKILELLQQLTLAQKPSNWFCIDLCTFILLHNSSLLTIHDIGYARKYGLKTRHARLDMVKELHFGANVLLAHFHYCCKGFHPFSSNWEAEATTSMAELDPRQIHFVRETANYVKINELRFKQIIEKEEYDHEHFLVAQLYEREWKPKNMF